MDKRKIAVLLAALLALALLFSALFIALETHHDCVGEDCVVCAQIRACEHFLRQLTLSAAQLALVCALLLPLVVALCPRAAAYRCPTPVTLKVKLSN